MKESSLFYMGCIQFVDNELITTLQTNKAIYILPKTNITDFKNLETMTLQVLKEISQKSSDIGPCAILTTKKPNNTFDAYYLFPNFDKDGMVITGDSAIAKAHRWYYRIIYTDFYKNTNSKEILCIDKTTQCPGVPVRTVITRPGEYNPNDVAPSPSTSTSTSTVTGVTSPKLYNEFDYYIIHNYYTPCGSPTTDNTITNASIYMINIMHPIFSSFQIYPAPNISMLTEFDGMRYGCDSQLVSTNNKYVLILEEERPGLVLYRVDSGEPMLSCRNNNSYGRTEVWRIPLSEGSYNPKTKPDDIDPVELYNFARFKLEDDILKLHDKDLLIWSYDPDTSNGPCILKLGDNGSLYVNDSLGNQLVTFSTDDFVAISKGVPPSGSAFRGSSKFFINRGIVQKNMEADQKKQEQQNLALQNIQSQKTKEEYNRNVCPVGL
jgi:hypothetical protein